MSNLPATDYLTDSARTEGEFKAGLESFLAGVKELPGGAAETTLTIAGGFITPTAAIHSVDTESGAASDDLTNINQTNHPDGRLLLIRCANASRAVVVKHSAGGTGRISLQGGADLTLNDTKNWLLLKRTGSLWEQVLPVATATPTASRVPLSDPAGKLDAWSRQDPLALVNVSLAASVESNALTVALKGANGNDPSASNPLYICFRSPTLTTGTYVIRAVTSALSLVVPSTATLGMTNGMAAKLAVWLIDNAGTVELAISNGSLLHNTNIISTTILNTGSGTAGVPYSTSARSNVACRFLGYIDITEATAGTWATAPTSINLAGPEPGVCDGVAQAAGFPGEYVESVAGSPASLTSGQWNNAGVTAITLQPGEWDIQAGARFYAAYNAGNYYYLMAVGVGTVTGNDSTGVVTSNKTWIAGDGTISGGLIEGVIWGPQWRVKINAPTTYYCKAMASFGACSLTAQGVLSARRIR